MAVNARDLADDARAVLGDACADLPRGELLAKARRARMLAQSLVDRAVMVELAAGATWAEVAEGIGLPVEVALKVYGPTWEVWLEDGSEPADADQVGTAEALDQWWRRHAEPWETAGQPAPVRALVDGQTPPRDR